MHDTAYEHGRLFFELYCQDNVRTVVELGSQDVNGALRDHAPAGVHYIGLDVMAAKGVDLIVDPDAPLPIADSSIDAVVTSSAFEHDVCFWETFLELTRILRPGGLLYLNAPSNGEFHRYPLDCWRFYPDAGVALTRWAARRGTQIDLVESFVGQPQAERWADFVAVFRKAGGPPLAARGRIADRVPAINIHAPPADELAASVRLMPDMVIADALRLERDAVLRSNETLLEELQNLSGGIGAVSTTITAFSSQVDALSGEVTFLRTALADARQQLNAIQTSTFWRLTAPLRCIARQLRGR